MPLSSILLNTYSSLMDTVNNGLLMVDEHSNICLCNRWFDQHCEYAMENKISVSLYELFPELENSRISDAISSTLEMGYPAVVSNIFTPTPFPLYAPQNFKNSIEKDERIQQQVTISRLEVVGEFYCLIQISDVTAAVIRERTLEQEVYERKQIEDALLESDIKHLTIMEKMVDGLIVFNASGQIDSFNPACEAMFGYSESEITGYCIFELFHGLTENNHPSCNSDMNINPMFIGAYREIKALRSDKEVFDVELSISEMNIAGNVYYTAIIRDITERKNVDKLKTEFISTVSHELRTPLTSIRGSLGLMSGGVIDLASEKAQELLTIAYNNCDRLVLLINDILDMEKIAADGIEYDIATHDLYQLLSRSIIDNKSYADEYKVTYQLTSKDKLDNNAIDKKYNVYIDQYRFLQVISNLLSNAAKFSSQNTIVDVRIFEENNHYIIEIEDYGDGIPEEFKETIWNKFTQVDASTTRKKGGTGLGLAISQSLMTAMGGKITFESTYGKGTTFIITLPIAKLIDTELTATN